MQAIFLTREQLQDVMMRLHRILPEKRIAMMGRLKHLQRLGWPPDSNPGKGSRVKYQAPQILEVALALELAQLGVTPERAVTLLTQNLGYVVIASRIACQWLEAGAHEVMYLYLDPTALLNLMDEAAEEAALETFFYGSWQNVRDLMDRGGTNDLTRIALINLTQIITQICKHLDAAGYAGSNSDFISGVMGWTTKELEGSDEADEVDELVSLSEPARRLLRSVANDSDP